MDWIRVTSILRIEVVMRSRRVSTTSCCRHAPYGCFCRRTVTVSGTTNDATSSPVKVTVNGDAVTVQENGSFSKVVTLTEGENTITVIATDSAGKQTTVVRHVTKDTGAPVFQSIELVPNPVDAGQTYIIRVKVTD